MRETLEMLAFRVSVPFFQVFGMKYAYELRAYVLENVVFEHLSRIRANN